ncbi:MAG: hypothetical protein J6K15_11440 [Lachnospiraceae bacterium]|nr:hypothetical protein [Lachnospiraceae bacterium]
MSKTFKRFFAGLLAFVLAFAMTAAAAPAKEVKADEEYTMFLAIGGDADGVSWGAQYSYGGDSDTANITPVTATFKSGDTVEVGIICDSEITQTWYTRPVIAVDGNDYVVDYTINSITVDGEDILAGGKVDLTAGDATWVENTGSVTNALCLAGGYNEWGTKYITEAPANYTELMYNITINSIHSADEYFMFLAIGAATDAAGSDWTAQYYGGSADDTANITATTAMVKNGGTYDIGITSTDTITKTWFVRPVVAADGNEYVVDYKINSIKIDGTDILGTDKVNMAADDKTCWMETTGPYTDAVNLAGGYNEWATKYIVESPANYKEIMYNITITGIHKASEPMMFLAIGAATDAAGSDWTAQYYGGSADDTANITPTYAYVAEGGTYDIGVSCDTEITKTWFNRPVIGLNGNDYTVDYTINSITVDGVEILGTDKVNLAADGKTSWAETTGPYADALCLAGGYNEWATKYLVESPANYKEIMYNITINTLEEKSALVGGTKYEGDMTVFLAMQGDVTAGAWDMTWINGSTDVAGVEPTMVTNAKSGDTVTIGLKFPQELVYTWWMAPVVMLNNAPADLVTTLDYTIDKITIDGEEVVPDLTLGSKPFWYEGTGDYTDTQAIRLKGGYNEWGDHYIESPQNYTEVMYTITLGDVVTGQVEGEAYNGEVTMFLAGQADKTAGNWDYAWINDSSNSEGVEGTVATAKAGDTVTLSLSFPTPVVHTWWLSPTVVFPEAEDGLDKYNVLYTIDKVVIDGNDVTDKVTLNNAAKLSWYEGTGEHPVTRTVRLGGGYNEWGADNAKCVDGTLLENFSKIEYTITLNMIYAEPVEEAPQLKADLDGTYNAYVGIQSGMYTFRNAWDDATYGRDTNPDAFGQMSFIEADQSMTKKAGTFKDAVIAGNGTYTLEINDLAWDDGSEALNLLFVSTDIPKSGEIVFSNVKVDFDGKNVMEFAEGFLDGDSKEVIKLLFINIWNKDLTNSYNMAGMLPKSNVKITFDVSGFNYDKAAEATPEPTPEVTPEPTEAPAEPTAAPTEAPVATEAPAEPTAVPTEAPADVDADAEGGMSPVVIVVIVVAVIAVAAGAAFVVMKKKK